MPSFTSSSYYFKDAEDSSKISRYVFDATKSNSRDTSIPEIGSTIYNTIPTGGDTFVVDMLGSFRSDRGTRPIHARGIGKALSRSYNVPRWRDRSSSRCSSPDEFERNINEERQQEEEDMHPLATAEKEDQLGGPHNRGVGGYYRDVLQSAENLPVRSGSISRSPRRFNMPTVPLPKVYDGTDREVEDIALSQRYVTPGTPRTPRKRSMPDTPGSRRAEMEKIARLGPTPPIPAGDISQAAQEPITCFLRLPIMVFTQQHIRIAMEARESWLYSVIYIYSVDPGQRLTFQQLDQNFQGAPMLNRRVNEVENNGRPANSRQEIYVQKDMIKITRSTVFHELYEGEQSTTSDVRHYNNLCPGEMTNATQREIYGDVPMRPGSMLNVQTTFEEQRFQNGNIETKERLIITLSAVEEPRATLNLRWLLEGRRITPPNYEAPVEYNEDILVGARKIEIRRDAGINPEEGLNRLMQSGQQPVFAFTETRRYGPYGITIGQEQPHPGGLEVAPAESPSSSSGGRSPMVQAWPISPSSSSGGRSPTVQVGPILPSYLFHPGESPSSSSGGRSPIVPVGPILPSSPSSSPSYRSPGGTVQGYVTAKPISPHGRRSRFREGSRSPGEPELKHLAEASFTIPIQETEPSAGVPVIQGLAADGTPIITAIVQSPGSAAQQPGGQSVGGSGTLSSEGPRSDTTQMTQSSQKTSRFSRFSPSKKRSPMESGTLDSLPGFDNFKPGSTSTPLKEDSAPRTPGAHSARNRYYTMERLKTSKNRSAGTGTHIRSTLDCDITLSTTKKVKVTAIPIQIEGVLNGLPWCTTIRLRVKHDANEKPTFIPHQYNWWTSRIAKWYPRKRKRPLGRPPKRLCTYVAEMAGRN